LKLIEFSGNYTGNDHFTSPDCMSSHLKYVASLFFSLKIGERDQN